MSLAGSCSNMFMEGLLCAKVCKVLSHTCMLHHLRVLPVKLVKLLTGVLNSVIAVIQEMPDLSRTCIYHLDITIQIKRKKKTFWEMENCL